MIKVLFVCLGNICRSPLAEAIFNQKIKDLNLDTRISSDSAGTSRYHLQEPPDKRTIAVAHKHNLPIDHLGRQIDTTDFDDFDYILAMDRENMDEILALKKYANLQNMPQINLIREFDNKRSGEDVPDPYFGGADGFEKVYQMLDESIDNFIKHIKQDKGIA
jgi:protein-tyrosine phosphatase